MTRLLVAPAGVAFVDAAACAIEAALADAVLRRGRASFALAGGGTPRPVYERLAARALSSGAAFWPRVHVYFGDERAVPHDHPDSNACMAHEALLSRLPGGVAAVHAMPAEVPGADDAPGRYAALLPERFDLLLAGLGDDGHILSLFPGSPLLAGTPGPVAWALAPAEPRVRLTLTPPVVRAARVVLVLVTGARKAEVVARVLTGAPDALDLPAAWVRERTWILDEPAANRLPHAMLVTATRLLEEP